MWSIPKKKTSNPMGQKAGRAAQVANFTITKTNWSTPTQSRALWSEMTTETAARARFAEICEQEGPGKYFLQNDDEHRKVLLTALKLGAR